MDHIGEEEIRALTLSGALEIPHVALVLSEIAKWPRQTVAVNTNEIEELTSRVSIPDVILVVKNEDDKKRCLTKDIELRIVETGNRDQRIVVFLTPSPGSCTFISPELLHQERLHKKDQKLIRKIMEEENAIQESSKLLGLGK